MVGHAELVEVLEASQRQGFLGNRPIPDVIEHAQGFVDALSDVVGSVVDLGAGGGVPGLVIAAVREDLRLTLVDRRTKRTDFLERMVVRMGLADRVSVVATDVERLIETTGATFDAAVARGFGPPLVTLDVGTRLVIRGGMVVISEPPAGDRWEDDDLVALGVERVTDSPGVAVFRRL